MLWIVVTTPGRDRVGIVEVGGRERRLPVMRVNDLRPERVDHPKADVRADTRERRKPLRIVGPVEPIGPKVWVARPVVEMGRIDREQVQTGRLAGEDPRGSTEQIVISMRGLRVDELGHYRRIARDERSDLDVFAGERGGQRARDVGKTPGLDKREDLRGDGENFQSAHCTSLSIIGLVIKVTPLSVRRNRLASSSGSSPTTRPSGIRTSLSMMALESRTLRPIVT